MPQPRSKIMKKTRWSWASWNKNIGAAGMRETTPVFESSFGEEKDFQKGDGLGADTGFDHPSFFGYELSTPKRVVNGHGNYSLVVDSFPTCRAHLA